VTNMNPAQRNQTLSGLQAITEPNALAVVGAGAQYLSRASRSADSVKAASDSIKIPF